MQLISVQFWALNFWIVLGSSVGYVTGNPNYLFAGYRLAEDVACSPVSLEVEWGMNLTWWRTYFVFSTFFTYSTVVEADGCYSSAPRLRARVFYEQQSREFIIAQIPRWVLLRAVQLIRLSAVDSTQCGIVVPLRIPLYGGVCGDYYYV